MKVFGIIGYPLSHTFSPSWFNKKFTDEKIDAEYKTFPIKDISLLRPLLQNTGSLAGLNVTLPFKTQVIPFLGKIENVALQINAVNTIKIIRRDHLYETEGYNTDVYGFEESIKAILPDHRNALVLGTGGGSAAVCFVLKKFGLSFRLVSRQPGKEHILSYTDLGKEIVSENTLIINTSPLGMYPVLDRYPLIPYHFLTPKHYLYDLVYNPEETLFLKKGKEMGTGIKNGKEMLILQAEKSWEIWNQ